MRPYQACASHRHGCRKKLRMDSHSLLAPMVGIKCPTSLLAWLDVLGIDLDPSEGNGQFRPLKPPGTRALDVTYVGVSGLKLVTVNQREPACVGIASLARWGLVLLEHKPRPLTTEDRV